MDGATAAGVTYELHTILPYIGGDSGQATTDGRKIDDLMYEFLNRVLISVPTEPGERAVVLPDLGGRTVTIAVDNAYLPFSYIPADTGVAEGW
ncbi:MAG: hypothetical protein QF498_01475, partial [Arenicellales bacterium]|nr:hypothetical protein [Arenicellales bacterium]